MLDWKVLRRELAIARIKAGLEEAELATAIEVDVSTVYRIEKSGSGKNNPSLDIIANWVEACGVTLTDFVARVEGETPSGLLARAGTGKTAVALAKVSRDLHALAPSDAEVREMATAQPVSADPLDHGQSRTVPTDLEVVRREMREATTELRLALSYAATVTATAVDKPGQKAAKARAALARKRKRPRKNSSKGAGAT